MARLSEQAAGHIYPIEITGVSGGPCRHSPLVVGPTPQQTAGSTPQRISQAKAAWPLVRSADGPDPFGHTWLVGKFL